MLYLLPILHAGTLFLLISQMELATILSWLRIGIHSLERPLLPYLIDHKDETLCSHLNFLFVHKFIFIQCKIGDSGKVLVLCTSFIPFDLSGAQRKLRVQDEASILKPAKLCLQNVVFGSYTMKTSGVHMTPSPHLVLCVTF